MNRFLSFIFLLSFHPALAAQVGQNHTSVVIFKFVPGYRTEDYVVSLLRKISLSQLKPDPDGSVIHIEGSLLLDVRRLPQRLQKQVVEEVTKVWEGQEKIAGASIEVENASLRWLEDKVPQEVSYMKPTAQSPLSLEQQRQMRLDILEKGCAEFLWPPLDPEL